MNELMRECVKESNTSPYQNIQCTIAIVYIFLRDHRVVNGLRKSSMPIGWKSISVSVKYERDPRFICDNSVIKLCDKEKPFRAYNLVVLSNHNAQAVCHEPHICQHTLAMSKINATGQKCGFASVVRAHQKIVRCVIRFPLL